MSADAAAVLAVRKAVGSRVGLRADANRRWSLEEALQFAREARGAGLDFIEVSLPSVLPCAACCTLQLDFQGCGRCRAVYASRPT